MDSAAIRAMADELRAGNRRALARAITLVESTRQDHREQASALLELVTPDAGNSVRLGITGVPGVGKSSFIEVFGNHVIDLGHRVAVLAVDPSSSISGGSILGDKTRMETLTRREEAFIRPSPAGRTLGGVARRTRETLLLCEAAGYDVIIVETVGVGQSETMVSEMTDMFLLLLLPGGGDELQGMKRGITELADLLLVNKADGDQKKIANHTVSDYRSAIHFLPRKHRAWTARVEACSAAEDSGILAVWERVQEFVASLKASGEWSERRARQALDWMWRETAESLLVDLKRHPAIAGALPALEAAVRGGDKPPTVAAMEIVRLYKHASAQLDNANRNESIDL
ncbi:MAG: methylmalonyl Co-A mutase-associated GTPase MeaB [Pseudomonadota bacterium]|nr:methylmalonyl Co-A mutase-associated GTPase MeaB [Pseudomonadota bacterium]